MSKEIENIITYNDKYGGVYACSFTGVPVENWDERGVCAFSYEFTTMRLRRLLGQVLTVIDASINNESQKKAVKDIIRNDFALSMSDLWETSESKYKGIIDESTKVAIEEESLEEALGA